MDIGHPTVDRRPANRLVTALSEIPDTTRGRLLEIAGALLVVGGALRYWLFYFNRGTNLLDEGSTAAQALRIIRGDMIYRDFFTVVTPGSYYTVAWLFDLFGTDLMVLRWAALAIGLGIVMVTLVASRRLVAWPFAATAALLAAVWGWFLVAPNFYSWEAMLFTLIALACYLRHAETSRPPWIVCAGAACGLSVMTKQNVGAYAAVALLLAIWLSRVFESKGGAGIRRRARLSARFLAGMCIPILPVLLFLVLAGAGPFLYESWIYYPFAKYPGRLALPYPAFYPVLPQADLVSLRDAIPAMFAGRIPEPAVYEIWIKFVLYLPLVVYPCAAVALATLAFRFHRRGRPATDEAQTGGRSPETCPEGHALLAVSLVGGLTLLQAWPRADVTHILFGMQPTFILLGYLSYCCWRGLLALTARLPRAPGLVFGAIALIVTLAPEGALLWNGYLRTNWEYSNYIVALKTERAQGVFASGEEAQRIDQVTRYLDEHTSPEEPIFVVPWAAGLYFLADRANPTRADFLLFEDVELQPCVLARLDQHPPTYVVYGYVWDVDGKHFRDYARPIDEYIRSRFELETSVNGYEIWRRIEGAGRAADAWPGACQPRRFRFRDLWGRSD